jgi:hypothetical protein
MPAELTFSASTPVIPAQTARMDDVIEYLSIGGKYTKRKIVRVLSRNIYYASYDVVTITGREHVLHLRLVSGMPQETRVPG